MRDVFAGVLLVSAGAWMQGASGAYHSDFDADYDEAAHVVSSLMMRDYVVAGFGSNPIEFAENYYGHYPKVAIGHWPPLFYTGEAAWMLAFGRSRTSLLTFEAAVAGALLLSVFLWVKRDCGTLAGLAAAIALATPQFMQVALYSVAPNMLVALAAFWAAAAYGRYLETGRVRDITLFAFLVLVSVGVHGRGFAVALLPLAAPLLRGREGFTKWRIASLFMACAALLLAPLWSRQLGPVSPEMLQNSWMYLWRTCVSTGLPVMVVAALGATAVVRGGRRRPRWLAIAALPLCTWGFQSLLNVGMADRYLVTAAPAVAALFGAGVHSLSRRFAAGGRQARIAIAAAALLVAVSLAFIALPPGRKSDLGYHRLANEDAAALGGAAVYLTAGDPLHEGALISEIALRDRQPKHIVLRASKVLAQSGWIRKDFGARFADANAVAAYLDDAHVGVVVMQERYDLQHAVRLREALCRNPAIWTEVTAAAAPAGARIFRRTGPLPPGDPHIVIDMRSRLGRYIEVRR